MSVAVGANPEGHGRVAISVEGVCHKPTCNLPHQAKALRSSGNQNTALRERDLPPEEPTLRVLGVRLLVLSSYPDLAAATRFRASAYFPALRAEGVEPDLRPFMTEAQAVRLYANGRRLDKAVGLGAAALRRAALALRLDNYDAVLVQREAMLIGPPWLELFLTGPRRLPLIFDFDDAIWLDTHQASKNPWAARLLKRPQKTAELVRLASHVIVGSTYLGDYARWRGATVTVLPTVVSRDTWKPLPGRLEGALLSPGGVPTIGWVGSHSSACQLEIAVPALRELSLRGHRFRVRTVGAARELRIPGVEVVSAPWQLDREVSDFQRADIAIVPMFDNEWSRGKCGFKELGYMAVGVPVVASAIGGGSSFLRHDMNALIARDSAAFTQQLERLLLDQALRARLARAGRQLVETRFCTEVQGPVLAGIVREVGRKRSR